MLDDPLIWILILPGMALGAFAQSRVKSAVARFSRVPLSTGLAGAEVARAILDARGLREVTIEGEAYQQGVWFDWDALRGALLASSPGLPGGTTIEPAVERAAA